MDLGMEEEQPLDSFLENEVQKKENMIKNIGYPADVMQSKEFTELKLGGGRSNKGLQQFLCNDRKVLRFYAYWDDTTRYGSRQYFRIHYYLGDDTVEILNAYSRNSGRWENPVFFTRGVLKLAPSAVAFPGMIEKPSPAVRPKDIVVGRFLPVYGRQFFVYDADDATKAFYLDHFGIDMQPIDIPEEPKYHIALSYPPKNVFGTEEDSLGSCLKLVPEQPKTDLVKLMTLSGVILRYEARPMSGQPEDAHRKFVISYYRMDDSVMCCEVKSRNSGQMEGKFRERSRFLLNESTGKNFVLEDFFVGNTVTISSMPMLIMRADEYALKHMEMNPDIWPLSDIRAIRRKLDAFDWANAPASLGPEAFREAVQQQLGFGLIDQEVVTVLRYCCEPDSADIVTDRLRQVGTGAGALDA